MDIEARILKLIEEKGLTLEEIAQKLSKNTKSITAQTLHKRFMNNKITFNETQKILNALGYTIIFTRKTKSS